MVISYRGRGWVVGAIACGCLLVAYLLTRFHYHDPSYYDRHGWPKLAGFWAAAVLVQIFVRSGEGEETLGSAEHANPQEARNPKRDAFFGIPVAYWPLLLLALGVAFYYLP